MSAEVIEFPERTLAGPARCQACGHEWHAVTPPSAVWLECPACHADKGRLCGPVLPDASRELWTCRCGSQAFALCRDEWLCYGCGAAQRFPA